MKAKPKIVDGVVVGQQIRCPACNSLHYFPAPRWSFNGDQDKPTFTPSLLIYYTHPKTKQRITICHSTVTDGRIHFHGDNPHAMKGQTVDLPDLNPDEIAD